ncbi:MAG: cell division protein SepF [Actinomycetota bacterium]
MANAMKKFTDYLGLTESEEMARSNQRAPIASVPRPRKKEETAKLHPVPSTLSMDRIINISPRVYSEARAIGEYYREGNPVIMNLSEMEDSERKRLIDFASGLVFGHAGTIERITAKVFLLTPPNVTVSGEEKSAAAQASLFNQS